MIISPSANPGGLFFPGLPAVPHPETVDYKMSGSAV